MQYSAICVKAYGDRSYPEYYPQIDEKGHFIPEPGDNGAVSADFTNLKLVQNGQTVFESEHGLDGKLFITDSRLVVMCEEYESAGFLWIGNPLLTVIAGIASSEMAKNRTAGKVLTGHVRFEWIESVVPQSEKILLGLVDESLVITYRDPFDSECTLAISLKNSKGLSHKLDAEIQKRFEQKKRKHLSEKKQKPELPAVSRTSSAPHMFCTNCGEKLKESDKYCRRCGAKQ